MWQALDGYWMNREKGAGVIEAHRTTHRRAAAWGPDDDPQRPWNYAAGLTANWIWERSTNLTPEEAGAYVMAMGVSDKGSKRLRLLLEKG